MKTIWRLGVSGIFLILPAAALSTAQPERPKETEALVDRARALAPEFRAEILLKLAKSPLIASRSWKLELIREAFDAAGGARNPLPRGGGPHTDTRSGWQGVSQATKLDGLTLRTGAILDMLALDRAAAQAMFGELHLPEWKPLTCADATYPRYEPYYETLVQIYSSTFTPEQRKREADIELVERRILAVQSPLELAPAAKLATGIANPEHRARALRALGSAMKNVRMDPRSFGIAGNAGFGEAARSHSGPDLRAEYRDYFVSGFGQTRCGDWLGRKSDPDAMPDIITAFNSLADEQTRAIRIEEIRGYREEPGGDVVEFWKSRRSLQVLELLRWLNHGNRDLPGESRFWTAEERRSDEWNAKYLELMRVLEDWKPDEESSHTECFNMKAHTYMSLAEQVPPGRGRDNAVGTLLSFLAQEYAAIDDPMQWFFPAHRLIGTKDPTERRYFLGMMQNCASPVISLYATVELAISDFASRAASRKDGR